MTRRMCTVGALALVVALGGCRRRVVVESSLVPVGGPAPAAATAAVRGIGTSDTAAVVAAAQAVLDAIGRRDTAAARALLVPGMVLVSMRADAGAAATPRVQPAAAFIAMLSQGSEVFLERMWSPVVRIDGAAATVSAPYDFHVDGRWSHCGTDVFTLLRTSDGWKVAGLSYTVQMQGCPRPPAGLPNPRAAG